MKLNTQRISGHMLQSALEYTRNFAPHSPQAILTSKTRQKATEFEKKGKVEKWRLGLAQTIINFLLPLALIFISSPYLHVRLPQLSIRPQICKPRWDIHDCHSWSLPSSTWRFKLVLWLYPAVSSLCSPPIPTYSCTRTHSPTHCFPIYSINELKPY